jgi:hypothetical protein
VERVEVKETVTQTDFINPIAISLISFTFYMNIMFVLQCMETCMEELLVSDLYRI